MCQAKIWLKNGKEEKEIFRDVVQLEINEKEEIVLRFFFEEPKKLKGKIKSIDFTKGKVVIEVERFPE